MTFVPICNPQSKNPVIYFLSDVNYDKRTGDGIEFRPIPKLIIKEDSMSKDYIDSLSTQELYEEFQRIVKKYWDPTNQETIQILSETEAAILNRILELHLLNLEDPALSEMARQVKNLGPYQKN